MPIQVLCLHGMGVNARVLELQLAPIRQLLQDEFVFTIPEAPYRCAPSPGAADFCDGPYRCWFRAPTNARMKAAEEHILSLIAEQTRRTGRGFDMVLGFSQGAALAASMLLNQRISRPSEEPLFKAAIFICSPLPFAQRPEYGFDIRRYFGIDMDSATPLPVPRPSVVPDYLIAADYFLQSEEQLAAWSAEAKEDDEVGSDSDDGLTDASSSSSSEIATPLSIVDDNGVELDKAVDVTWPEKLASASWYNMFHPSVDECRIDIPTAHVYGARDPWRRHSMDLKDLCSQRKRSDFEHDGGHEIPRDAAEDICDMFEDLVSRAGLLV